MVKDAISHRARYHKRFMKFMDNLAEDDRLQLDGPGTGSIGAWFLGPKAENKEIFGQLIQEAVDNIASERETQFPDDPPFLVPERRTKQFDDAIESIKTEYRKLLRNLRQRSIPFYSYRYQAHMNWDLTLPGLLGYFAAMLHNQNNVALEGGPVTSQLEKMVSDDICCMLGYNVDPEDTSAPLSWGHIACDGSVANLEAMWAARNLMFFPLGVKQAIMSATFSDVLYTCRDVTVMFMGRQQKLVDLDSWQLLNLSIDEALALPDKLTALTQVRGRELMDFLGPCLVQELGLHQFLFTHCRDTRPPVVLGSSTKHYSWTKNCGLVGFGAKQFLDINVDRRARLDMDHLRQTLTRCLSTHTPVAMVLVVLGSTEESAVDPLVDVYAMREEFRQQGLDFVIHVDAAWGGYFASRLHGEVTIHEDPIANTPVLDLPPHAKKQFIALGTAADTITIDPHKAGYIPYPAGGLCYKNGTMKGMIALLASEVYHGSDEDDHTAEYEMGVYGVEGSKPGAAAAAVYLSHRIIRPDNTGYGLIMGQCIFASKLFYSAIVTMATEEDDFIVVPIQEVPAEAAGKSPAEIKSQLDFIKSHIVDRTNAEIVEDAEAMDLLHNMGSDLTIVTYGFNFKVNGVLNTDPLLARAFMGKIFNHFSVDPSKSQAPELVVTTSEFELDKYGSNFVKHYMQRLGLSTDVPCDMNFISSTTMCPYLTATSEGNFIPTLTKKFREAIIGDIIPKMTE